MTQSVGHGAADAGSKLVSAEQALAAVRPGSRIFLGTGCAAPRGLLAKLEGMAPGPADLEFVSFVTTSCLPAEGGVSDDTLPSPDVFRRQRRAWPRLQRSARLRADLPGSGTGAAGDRPAADRRGPAAGLLSRCARLRQPRRLGGSGPCGARRRDGMSSPRSIRRCRARMGRASCISTVSMPW